LQPLFKAEKRRRSGFYFSLNVFLEAAWQRIIPNCLFQPFQNETTLINDSLCIPCKPQPAIHQEAFIVVFIVGLHCGRRTSPAHHRRRNDLPLYQPRQLRIYPKSF